MRGAVAVRVAMSVPLPCAGFRRPPVRGRFGPEAMPGAANEDIFQAWLGDRNRLDHSGEGFDRGSDEAMTVAMFQANGISKHCGLYVETLGEAQGQCLSCFGSSGFE